MVLPSRDYVECDDGDLGDMVADEAEPGIERHRLARRFRGTTDADLRTAAAHYLYHKPA